MSFVSLVWPWSGRLLPQGESVGVLGSWTGAQCGWAPSSPTTSYVMNPQYDRLTLLHMTGWLASCSWLAISQNVIYHNMTLPPSRDILWPSVLLLWLG